MADDDLGLFLYYVRFGIVNHTPRLAGLSVGHRDVHAATQNVTIRFLEEQRHGSVLSNPLYQLLGYLDFSFVLIYLFPLVVIALCFNIWSEEREGGTWRLVMGQFERPVRLLWAKWALRFGVVLLTLLGLLVVAKIYLAIPVDAYFLAYVAVAVLYVTFWFSLSWFVVRLGRSSSQSALSLLVAWVLLTIVVPSGISALEEVLYPTPEAYEAMLLGRDGYHEKWDMPIDPTVDRFKEIYPQYARFEHPEGATFGWLWYYAMQHLGDAEAAPAAASLRAKLERRDALSRRASYFIPTAHTQLTLNRLSRSDMTNYFAFQDALQAFHEAKRLEFYEGVFAGASVSSVDWKHYEAEVFRASNRTPIRFRFPHRGRLLLGGIPRPLRPVGKQPVRNRC